MSLNSAKYLKTLDSERRVHAVFYSVSIEGVYCDEAKQMTDSHANCMLNELRLLAEVVDKFRDVLYRERDSRK